MSTVTPVALASARRRPTNCPPHSCPVSSRGLVLVREQGLEGSVVGGVVGGVGLPAVPDDVEPGSGEDADGVWVVLAAVDGAVVDFGGPGVGVAGIVSEVADGIAEVLVAGPAKP